MARPRTLPPALAPAVLAGAMALPLALGAIVPDALALGGAPTRETLTADERAFAALNDRRAVAERLAEEQLLARDVRGQHIAAAEAAARAAAEQAAAEQAAAEQAAAEQAAAEQAAAEQAAAERRAADRASRSRRSSGDPRAVARAMLADRGQADQFGCLDRLWLKESGWKVSATNPSSGAYGIPQALPAGKMASAGADWRTNAATQIRWGLGYISSRYGSPCAAWRHSQRNNWY
jgi:hypothetical protein